MKQLELHDIERITQKYGDSFYILDTDLFEKNFYDLQFEMRKYYEKTEISYSYKTNYIPRLCEIVKQLGGYAEVVSDMERELALEIGVPHEKIVFNGPYKRKEALLEAVSFGELVNIDSRYDLDIVLDYAREHEDKNFAVGIRCNFDVDDSVCSRFGMDVESSEFRECIDKIEETPNVIIQGLHCHFASRALNIWKNKINKMLSLLDELKFDTLKYVSVGGGIYGRMDDVLKLQFSVDIPNFCDYAEVIAKPFGEYYKGYAKKDRPILFLEPGSALAGDAMRFVAKVINIKNIRGKNIATLTGSVYNINPTLNGKNPPIQIVGNEDGNYCDDIDFAGYTCIESDYLYKGYSGKLVEGNYVVFGNVGSYSVVLKPPFILPNFVIVEISDGKIIEVKKSEQFKDIFGTYHFDKGENKL